MKKTIVSIYILLAGFHAFAQSIDGVSYTTYLNDIKTELQKEWPDNKTINLVFHGHSVPAGFFKTPEVNTLGAYPMLVLKKIKAKYPFAVINVIVTGIGGEDSSQGRDRFDEDVLIHRPDVLFIDYGLNDRRLGLEASYEAWDNMIKKAKNKHIKVILLTPSPDLRVDYSNPNNELKQHANQIIRLAVENQIGVVDSFKSFEFLYKKEKKIKKYMSQVNHPNEKGHDLIAEEIVRWF